MVIVGILGLGAALLLFWFKYTSPINEAGREYRQNVRAYRNVEIETMDDVYERLDVLDAHFNSTTFDKVQNEEKTEITRSDIETLFGKPHEVVNDVDMYYATTVYQYFYDDITLNFHEDFSTIDEYVVEDFNGTFYDAAALDQLFVDALNHPAEITENTTTRIIRQSGWNTWSFNRQVYFDDGNSDYSPKEYLSLQFKEDDADELHLMERRYNDAYAEIDTSSEMEKKARSSTHFY